jgi:hypothetical protein
MGDVSPMVRPTPTEESIGMRYLLNLARVGVNYLA